MLVAQADGTPLVNASKFPDLKALVKQGDDKGVRVGWYQVNRVASLPAETLAQV